MSDPPDLIVLVTESAPPADLTETASDTRLYRCRPRVKLVFTRCQQVLVTLDTARPAL